MKIPFVFPFQSREVRKYIEVPKKFSQAECDAIIALGKRLMMQRATVSSERRIDEDMRKSNVGWFDNEPAYNWIWTKVTDIVRQMNDQYFHFDLVGCFESMQFTEYNLEGSHYDWHTDHGNDSMSKRKLSIVVQLSDPATYKGGELQLFFDKQPITAQRDRGNIIIFPSYTLHKVCPIEEGVRYSLVLWVSGATSYK